MEPTGRADDALPVTTDKTHRRDVIAAKAVLRGIEKRRHARAESARERVLRMMALLDTLLTRMPEDAPETDMREIERIVNALRTADQSLSRGITGEGMQALELAGARIQRLAARFQDQGPI